MMLFSTLVLCFSLFSSVSFGAPSQLLEGRDNFGTVVNLRVEGLRKTIFEGPIFTRGHVVTTPSGGSHQCNGLNNNSNPRAGPTATSALDDAAHHAGFPFDGTFFADFDDFLITSIGPDTQTSTQFWGLLLNFQFTLVGGCQQEVKFGDRILWAFDAFNANAFLELSGPEIVKKGHSDVFTVTDGLTGKPVQGATVGGQTTDANGHASVTFGDVGTQDFKATKASTIRSNKITVLVL